MYMLNTDENNRVLSVGIISEEYITDNDIMVEDFPKGNLYDYLYINGEFIYDPLPKPELTDEERLNLEAENLADMPATQSLNNDATGVQNLDSQDTAELLKAVLMELQDVSERLDALESAQIK